MWLVCGPLTTYAHTCTLASGPKEAHYPLAHQVQQQAESKCCLPVQSERHVKALVIRGCWSPNYRQSVVHSIIRDTSYLRDSVNSSPNTPVFISTVGIFQLWEHFLICDRNIDFLFRNLYPFNDVLKISRASLSSNQVTERGFSLRNNKCRANLHDG